MVDTRLLDIDKLAVLDERSGWRDVDKPRVTELTNIFIGGQWGLTCGSDITVLQTTTLDQDRSPLNTLWCMFPKFVRGTFWRHSLLRL